MLFNSLTFALFLPLVFVLYLVLPLRGRQIMLLAASYVFYCWEKPIYGLLLVASTVLDFSCGLLMNRSQRRGWRRSVLLASVCGNLGLLGFFKYGDFVAGNLVGIGSLLGFGGHWEPMGFILPVGISFYTFQTMSYSIELYRRKIEPCRDLVTFALFVSFFPQLVAGPIERADRLLPQLRIHHHIRWDDAAAGLQRILLGLFRKMVLADRFAIMVDRCYAHIGELNSLTLWVGAFCFSMQIYFDFAGYADIAIGTARLFGIRLTENFRRPLMARNIADFWNRWHITLTSWLRDYVFTPLGGARGGAMRTMFNGVVVLLLCGLWHGASWHFVAWGAYHAVHMMVYYAWRYRRKRRGIRGRGRPALWAVLLMTLGVMTVNTGSAVLFRARDMHQAGRMFAGLFRDTARMLGMLFQKWDMHGVSQMISDRLHLNMHSIPTEWYVWIYALLVSGCIIVEFCQEHFSLSERTARLPWPVRAAGLAALALLVLLGASNLTQPYIYFQF